MDIEKINSCSFLPGIIKPIIRVSELPINTPVPILLAKIVKSKFGDIDIRISRYKGFSTTTHISMHEGQT